MYPTFRQDSAREMELLDKLCAELCKLDGIVVNGSHDAPHILNLSIPGVPTQNSLNLLQDKGICVSAGSACAKGHRSHTLTAMKLDSKVIDSSFRISLCRDTTDEQVNAFLEGLQSILDWKHR
jgi:cysteine desulfurase